MAYDPKNFRYQSGLQSVGPYQVSGLPYLSASTAAIPVLNGAAPAYKVQFPYVTQWIIVENNTENADLRIGFSQAAVTGKHSNLGPHGVDSHYWTIPSASISGTMDARNRLRLDVRVKEMYLMSADASRTATAQVAAGLTIISTSSVPNFTNWSGSIGVG